MQVRAVVDGEVEMRANRFFGKDDAGFVLEQRDDVAAGRQRREARTDLRRIEHFMIEVMFLRTAQAAGHHLALGPADHQSAGDLQQPAAGLPFELPPQFIRAPQQRHVGGMLEVREPDDARAAVARSLIVRGLKLLEAEHALAARCGVRRGRAAHAAEADNDHVETVETRPR